MIASVHIANVGPRSALSLLRAAPKPAGTPGLRTAEVALAAPLSASLLGRPDFGRVALVAFWDDEPALDRFLADDPFAARLAGGWHVRLEPLRAFGSWPGLPADTPTARAVDHDGPVAVLMGRLRLSQTVRFLRTSATAEARVLGAARPRVGDRSRAPAVGLDVLALGVDARARDLCVRTRRARAPRGDRRG